MHNLLHICEDVKQFGTIGSYSAFKFENYLYTIKKSLKVCGKPLEQIVNRIIEKRNVQESFSTSSKNHLIIYYNKNKTKVNRIEFDGYMLSSKNPNNCCILLNGTIVTINDIYLKNNILYFTVKKHLSIKPFFTFPCDSTLIGIYELCDNEADLSYTIVIVNQISNVLKQIMLCLLMIIQV